MKRTVLAFLLVVPFTLQAQSLRITGGAVDNQVFQRSSSDQGTIPLEGTASGVDGKSVAARVLRNYLPLEDFDWKPLTKVSAGKWKGSLAGVPTGGPYHVEVKIEDTDVVEAVSDLLVGDLWVLGGQSNMEGYADLIDVEPPSGVVHSFDMTDHWLVAQEPLHRLVDALNSVHWRVNPNKERLTGAALQEWVAKRKKGASLGLPFAAELARRTGVPIGLIPCAHGGTSMAQWSPALKDQGGASLYGGMLRRFRAAGGHVAGLLWYQGESDASPEAAAKFQEKFERFVASVRRDFGQPDLPFYYVQIGRFIITDDPEPWNKVQQVQVDVESTIPHSGMVASIDLSLDDLIHVGTQGQKRLGHRLANLAVRDLFPKAVGPHGLHKGPRPAAARFSTDGTIRVEFDHVNGKLRAPGRIGGFTVHGPDGKALPSVFDARFDPAAPNVVVLKIQRGFREPVGKGGGERAWYLPEGAALYYGYGKDPYCNVTDEADMAVPAFGPMEIE